MFSVRLSDGRTIYETYNPLTACREWIQVKGKKAEASILSPSRAASLALYEAIKQNQRYIYLLLNRSGVAARDVDEATDIVVKAAGLEDNEIEILAA